MKYGIGIDTRGTFTDSVIIDFNSHRIISKAKALTTREVLEELAAPLAGSWGKSLLMELKVTAIAIGEPYF